MTAKIRSVLRGRPAWLADPLPGTFSQSHEIAWSSFLFNDCDFSARNKKKTISCHHSLINVSNILDICLPRENKNFKIVSSDRKEWNSRPKNQLSGKTEGTGLLQQTFEKNGAAEFTESPYKSPYVHSDGIMQVSACIELEKRNYMIGEEATRIFLG